MAKSLKPSDFEIEDGAVITRSGQKTVIAVIGFGALVVLGLFILLVAGGACFAGIGARGDKHASPALIFGAAGLALLMGLCAVAFGGTMVFYWLTFYLQKERLVLSADSLQWVLGDEVRLHLPYDNISKLNMSTVADVAAERGEVAPTHFIAIEIMDPFRHDTLIDRSAIKDTRNECNCDVTIFDNYNLPLDRIYKKLKKKWGAKRKY